MHLLIKATVYILLKPYPNLYLYVLTIALFSESAFTNANAASPFSAATFHCISVYWTPDNGSNNKNVLVRYRVSGSTKWLNALPIRYSDVKHKEVKATYRGSIVNLTPNTLYEISLQLENSTESISLTQKTMNEIFPVGKVTVIQSRNTTYTIPATGSGTAGAYQVYDGKGTAVINPENNSAHVNGINIQASYIIVRNLTIKNVKERGIRLTDGAHHVIIEGCDISKWGSLDSIPSTNTEWGIPSHTGIFSSDTSVRDIIIQRNKIHHPNWDTNTWLEEHRTANKHPQGPQCIFFQDSGGGNIIRYNEFWSDTAHYYNDVIGGSNNSSPRGFPGADSDIYGNYVSGAHDDGIEAEGGNQNVRIWNNYIENYYNAIANAITGVGPLYIWRNVVGKGNTSSPLVPAAQYGVKMGFAGGDEERGMTGHQYFFNNTFLQVDKDGTGGLGTNGGNARIIRHFMSRNNILESKTGDASKKIISDNEKNIGNDFDYDLFIGSYPATQDGKEQELHAVKAKPQYVVNKGLDITSKKGNFALKLQSPGSDAGVIIPNFSDVFFGKGPDIGAQESNTEAMQFGVKANFVPAKQ